MDSQDILLTDSQPSLDTIIPDTGNITQSRNDDLEELKQQVITNFQKPNVPNINIPEKIIICLDVCYDDRTAVYKFDDGTTFTLINMMKRVVDFFLHSKHAINKRTEFALIVMKDLEPCWVHNFTNNVKEIINTIDHLNSVECTADSFDFQKVFDIIQHKVDVPKYNTETCIIAPPYVVRMIVLYGRSNCLPKIPQDNDYFISMKKEIFFYTDILLAHEEECALYKCEEVYDALQDLDNGYSYVYEVSRNATKIHDCIAKLLAHPLQRPLQKNTDYTFKKQRSNFKE